MKKIEGEIKEYVTCIIKRDDNSWLVWGDGQGIYEKIGTVATTESVHEYIKALHNQMKLAEEYLETLDGINKLE